MANLKYRLDKLEEKVAIKRLANSKLVFCEPGESCEEAIKRLGISTEGYSRIFCINFVSPKNKKEP